MRNYVNLLGSYAIDLLEETFASVGHYNEAVREFIELVHQRLLIRIWLAQHGVLCRYHWHVYVAQKSQKMAAGRPPVDAKLVLDRDYLDVIDVEEVSRAPIGIEFLLVDFKSHLSRIIITFGSIIDCAHHALALWVLRSNSLTNVRGKGSNAALTRKMIPQEGYAFYGRCNFHCLDLLSEKSGAAGSFSEPTEVKWIGVVNDPTL